MRRSFLPAMVMALLLAAACATQAATGSVIKVLPFFLDQQGRHMLAPSLYERDAYQAYLLAHPGLRFGLMFKVQWKTKGHPSGPLKLRVELRGTAEGDLPKIEVLEQPLKPSGWFSRWASLKLVGPGYKGFGQLTAWRVTLWEGDTVLGHQQSFLW